MRGVHRYLKKTIKPYIQIYIKPGYVDIRGYVDMMVLDIMVLLFGLDILISRGCGIYII